MAASWQVGDVPTEEIFLYFLVKPFCAVKYLWVADLPPWTVSMILGMAYFLVLHTLSFTEFLLMFFVTMTKGGQWWQASLLRDGWAFCHGWMTNEIFLQFSLLICWENQKWLESLDTFFVVCFCGIYYPTTRMLWTSATGPCRERRRQQIIWGLACTSCQGPQLCCWILMNCLEFHELLPISPSWPLPSHA